MKTEGLTWAEAIRAYADGKRVKDVHGTEFWIEGEMPCTLRSNCFVIPNHYAEPFSIVQPTVKTLSFDEAEKSYLAGRVLKVECPNGGITRIHNGDERFKDFDLHVICYLDLAERRGWPITEAAD